MSIHTHITCWDVSVVNTFNNKEKGYQPESGEEERLEERKEVGELYNYISIKNLEKNPAPTETK